MAHPIGGVTWGEGGTVSTATLRADRTWAVEPDDPGMAETLRAIYSDDYAGPSDGPYGPAILAKVAEWLGGTVELVDRPGGDPDVVY